MRRQFSQTFPRTVETCIANWAWLTRPGNWLKRPSPRLLHELGARRRGVLVHTFRLAPMSRGILILTFVLLALPVAFLGKAVLGDIRFVLPGALLVAIYAWVWLRFRPSLFVVHPGALEMIWPLKRRQMRRAEISDVRLIDKGELRREIGWGMRVGAGGLWGGFGWLWTARRGIVQMYISRTDGFVWIERGDQRPWLITPERPEAFVRALSS